MNTRNLICEVAIFSLIGAALGTCLAQNATGISSRVPTDGVACTDNCLDIPVQMDQIITIWTGTGSFTAVRMASAQEGTAFHQVVNRYFDREGREIEVRSATHAFTESNCHPGRVQHDQIVGVSDDGKGNVIFSPPASHTYATLQ